MNITNSLCAGVASLLCVGIANAGAATLIGDEVDVVLTGGIELSDFGVLVGPGVEFEGGNASTNWGAFLFVGESIDIGATTIDMIFDLPLGSDAMLTFSDLDFGAGIGGVSLLSTIPAVGDAQLSFTTDSITLDLTSWFTEGGGGTLQLELSEVPAPGALALLGLAGMSYRRRRD